jgi:sporadic carbohydrate cluster 2OG-Fe(II) oxygenase
VNDFFPIAEQALCDRFLKDLYVPIPVEDRTGLDRIRDHVAALAAKHLGVAVPNDAQAFLDTIHQRITVEQLNGLRMAVFGGMNAESWFRPTYLRLARQAVETLIGNELALQRRINLSVQLPKDDSSLLPIHADVWDGDSPYEVVVWLPLVNCFKTKSMYIMPAAQDRAEQEKLARFATGSAEDIYQEMAERMIFLDVPYGHILLFSQTVMHGNRVNNEDTTRWSMHCRVKSLLSPYADKRLGEFFEPIVVRPATRIGANYALPQGFDK